MNSRRALWVLFVVLCATSVFAQPPFLFTCAEDTHIETAKREALNSTAMKFVETLMGSDVKGGYDMMSAEGKANVTPDQLAQAAQGIKQFEPKNPEIQHTYFVELKGKSPGNVVCAMDLTKPEGWESVAATSAAEQAHVILSAETRNNKLAFSIWLVPEQKTWKVQSFWMNVSTLADKDSKDLWQLGREQVAKNHNFNAALLFAAAGQVANRGPSFQLGITQAIREDLSKLDLPVDIQGQPPFLWKNGQVTYKVMNVGPIAIAGKMYIIIVHQVSPWQSDAQVDGWNKELLSYFKRRFPEYSDVFSGLVARAIEQGTSRGFGTVEEVPSAKTSATK